MMINMKEYKVDVYDNGDKYWFLRDKLHREDGPAVEHTNGCKEWFLRGKRHREDGPAIEFTNGNKAWFLNGKQLTEKEFNDHKQSCDGRVISIDGIKYQLSKVK